jgi:hypothetical protein
LIKVCSHAKRPHIIPQARAQRIVSIATVTGHTKSAGDRRRFSRKIGEGFTGANMVLAMTALGQKAVCDGTAAVAATSSTG